MPSSGLGGLAVAAPPTHTFVVTEHGRESETITATREGGYGKKRMSRETWLSYNTVKKYLERMDAESAAGARDGKEGTVIVSYGTGPTLADGIEVQVAGEERPEGTRAP